jgi:hypothetical protein
MTGREAPTLSTTPPSVGTWSPTSTHPRPFRRNPAVGQRFFLRIFASVGDPDPQDPHVFGHPGSGFFPFLMKLLSGLKKGVGSGVGSGSVSLQVRIRIRIKMSRIPNTDLRADCGEI